jgi:hypothetical protein
VAACAAAAIVHAATASSALPFIFLLFACGRRAIARRPPGDY